MRSLTIFYLGIAFSCIVFEGACTKQGSNPVPVANAGTSQVITLPTDTVTLTGTATDAGQVASYLWDQVSGPGSSTIEDPGALSTVVTGLVQGTYIFQLSVFDRRGGVGTDTMAVVVNPSPVKTLTLQPANNPYELTVGDINGQDASGLTISSIGATAWTTNGNPWIIRGLVKFDLSTLPSTATIQSANLYLYTDSTPTTGNQIDANYGANSFVVQQVGNSWTPSGVSWTNQPTGLTSNEIVLPSTNLSFLDMNIDVTSMVANMVSNNTNYGFLLELQNETPYASRIFYASHNPAYPAKYPKLVVVYQ